MSSRNPSRQPDASPQIVATTTSDAFWTLDPFAVVNPGDPWFADIEGHFDPTRYGLVSRLLRRLRPGPARPPFVHIGIVGHKGSGKTTQVRRAMSLLEKEGIAPVYVDALASLDQADFSFADVVLVIARSVVEFAQQQKLSIPESQVKLLELWFSEELLTEEHRNELLGGIETELRAKGGIPYLATLMAKVTAVFKSNNIYRREIRKRAERDPADLLRRANALLDSVGGDGRRLVVVVDNLEKITDRKLVDAAILRRADDVRKLRSHLVLFFDPADQYAPVTVQASQAFDVVTLPMLPVRERHDAPNFVQQRAKEACLALLSKRMNVDAVLSDPQDCLERILHYSGGRLRDVLHIARNACELADPNKVTGEHIEIAVRKLKGERVTIVRPDGMQRLVDIARAKTIANREEDAYLLLHSLVLNYNGEPWWDVHPLVRLDEEFQRLSSRLQTPG